MVHTTKKIAPGWVYWVISTTTAAFTILTFAYANFPTRIEHERLQTEVDRMHENVLHNLERLELKVDTIIRNQKGR